MVAPDLDPRALVVLLESPYTAYDATIVPARLAILAGLHCQREYWSGLAVSWLDAGAPIDDEIAESLDALAREKSLPQQLRHKAFAYARRYFQRQTFNEHDVVCVAALKAPGRSFHGAEGVKRIPCVGDVGAVIRAHYALDNEYAYSIECIDADGQTLWVADFFASELRLVSNAIDQLAETPGFAD